MSSISTPWSVRVDEPVTSADVGEDGLITDAAVARWVGAARSTYLRQCAALDAARANEDLELRSGMDVRPPGARLHGAPSVVVTATATEVFPTSFVVSVRIRPYGGDLDEVVNVACDVRLEDPATGEPRAIDDAIRDELIALEHAARHFN